MLEAVKGLPSPFPWGSYSLFWMPKHEAIINIAPIYKEYFLNASHKAEDVTCIWLFTFYNQIMRWYTVVTISQTRKWKLKNIAHLFKFRWVVGWDSHSALSDTKVCVLVHKTWDKSYVLEFEKEKKLCRWDRGKSKDLLKGGRVVEGHSPWTMNRIYYKLSLSLSLFFSRWDGAT